MGPFLVRPTPLGCQEACVTAHIISSPALFSRDRVGLTVLPLCTWHRMVQVHPFDTDLPHICGVLYLLQV